MKDNYVLRELKKDPDFDGAEIRADLLEKHPEFFQELTDELMERLIYSIAQNNYEFYMGLRENDLPETFEILERVRKGHILTGDETIVVEGTGKIRNDAQVKDVLVTEKDLDTKDVAAEKQAKK